MTEEEWRPVLGYEGLYEVSSLGRVKSLGRTMQYSRIRKGVNEFVTRTIRGRIMSPGLSHGYRQVSLFSSEGARSGRWVHVLVCEAFHGPRPGNAEASHLNGVSSDNRAENLCWESASANQLRKREHGTMQAGERHRNAKLNWDSVACIRILDQAGVKPATIARSFMVSHKAISRILAGETWVR